MRTDDLICMIAKTPPPPCSQRNAVIWGGVTILLAVLIGITAMALGFRPGLSGMIDNSPMLFKYALLAAVSVGSGIAWWYSGHPLRTYRIAFSGLIFLATFLVCAAINAAVASPDTLGASVFDHTAFFCVGFITAFAAVGSLVLVKLTGCMAPTKCRVHAFLTALFAASLGAFAYGLHCPHDHPAYLVLWYGGTILTFSFLATPLIMRKQAW